jgi:excisionase family DNA binding protein
MGMGGRQMNDDYTLPEVAQLRGVKLETVRKWVQRGHLKAIKRAGAWFVDPADLNQFKPARRGPKVKERKQ